ncbi:beta-2 adrenergic receptor-like [Limulus polyphemus]|uniref:Beta-2 adrenergic receptor-like n=1 Tax=Limulus polyphemus TaxID=6850 RepID=A0ABM1SWZ6_LIMPO|nr:beta-2 adrenergic receptor-like [Limulus polyphemus]
MVSLFDGISQMTCNGQNSSNGLPFFGQSCWDNSGSLVTVTPGATEVIKAVWIIFATIAILTLNILMIVVLHSRNHSRYLRQQPRMFMTSLACTDLAVGLFVTPFSVFPALYRCWPFGRFLCAMEALLISALFHESTLALMCVAIDRYICIVFPLQYHTWMTRKVLTSFSYHNNYTSNKVCLLMILSSWFFSVTAYCIMIYPSGDYYFDTDGIQVCEPYYANKTIIILACTLFFFPPLVIILFCYVAILYIARKQIRTVYVAPSTIDDNIRRCSSVQEIQTKEKIRNYRSALTVAAIALGFVAGVTPWTMTQLITSVLESSPSSDLEFTVTWIAVSNSFWNPIIYGVLNKSFRSIALDILRRMFWKAQPSFDPTAMATNAHLETHGR